MTGLEPAELPSTPGAYRWYYADVTAGHYQAVAIFMIGSVFSPRYSAGQREGALPTQHSAVNFALYDRGTRKCWVMSEYGQAVSDGAALRIGRSTFSLSAHGALFEIEDVTARGGKPVLARLRLVPLGPGAAPQLLEAEGGHHWQPLMPRAIAELDVPTYNLRTSGFGYVDTNHGDQLLGGTLPSWNWVRTHADDTSFVSYQLPGGEVLELAASLPEAKLSRTWSPGSSASTLTAWGLRVPRLVTLAGKKLRVLRLLESSPFYARYLAEGEGLRAIGEVADFRRFHSPFIRWMASYRTLVRGAA